MPRGKLIGDQAREIIYKVYLYISSEANLFYTKDGYFQQVHQRVSEATGVSIGFISRLVQEKGKPKPDYVSHVKVTIKRKQCDDIQGIDTKIPKTNEGTHTHQNNNVMTITENRNKGANGTKAVEKRNSVVISEDNNTTPIINPKCIKDEIKTVETPTTINTSQINNTTPIINPNSIQIASHNHNTTSVINPNCIKDKIKALEKPKTKIASQNNNRTKINNPKCTKDEIEAVENFKKMIINERRKASIMKSGIKQDVITKHNVTTTAKDKIEFVKIDGEDPKAFVIPKNSEVKTLVYIKPNQNNPITEVQNQVIYSSPTKTIAYNLYPKGNNGQAIIPSITNTNPPNYVIIIPTVENIRAINEAAEKIAKPIEPPAPEPNILIPELLPIKSEPVIKTEYEE